MSESNLWAYIRNRFRTIGEFERVENSISAGMPDVNYCINSVDGWIELKYVARWPIRDRIVKVGMRGSQYAWFRKRIRRCKPRHNFLLAQVGSDYLLFRVNNLIILELLYHGCTKAQLIEIASLTWKRTINRAQFLHIITSKGD